MRDSLPFTHKTAKHNMPKKRKDEILTYLYAITKQLAQAAIVPDQLFKLVVRAAVDVTGAKAAALMLVDEESGGLTVAAASGLKPEQFKGVTLSAEKSVAAMALKEHLPLNIPDIEQEPHLETIPALKGHIHSVLSAPILAGGEPVGVIEAYFEEVRRLTRDEIQLFSAFADSAAVAINSARFYERLRKIDEQLALAGTQARELAEMAESAAEAPTAEELPPPEQELPGGIEKQRGLTPLIADADAALEMAAKAALARHPLVEGGYVEVDVMRGKVYLRGVVPSIRLKKLAEELVQHTAKVQQVVNELRIAPWAPRYKSYLSREGAEGQDDKKSKTAS